MQCNTTNHLRRIVNIKGDMILEPRMFAFTRENNKNTKKVNQGKTKIMSRHRQEMVCQKRVRVL